MDVLLCVGFTVAPRSLWRKILIGLTNDKSGSFWRTHAVEPSQRPIRIPFCELQRRLGVLPADAHHAASATLIESDCEVLHWGCEPFHGHRNAQQLTRFIHCVFVDDQSPLVGIGNHHNRVTASGDICPFYRDKVLVSSERGSFIVSSPYFSIGYQAAKDSAASLGGPEIIHCDCSIVRKFALSLSLRTGIAVSALLGERDAADNEDQQNWEGYPLPHTFLSWYRTPNDT